MSRPDSFLTFDQNISTTTLATVTSTAALAIGKRKTFSITADGPFNYKLGTSAVAAAAATDPLVASGIVMASGQNTHVRIFNPSGTTITYSLVSYANA